VSLTVMAVVIPGGVLQLLDMRWRCFSGGGCKTPLLWLCWEAPWWGFRREWRADDGNHISCGGRLVVTQASMGEGEKARCATRSMSSILACLSSAVGMVVG
jgi:hypothetical protein